ncbi:MAG TPA: hypothetical protein VNG33_22045 [Polyangiaceae bacterium]|nr:hypothetical protein [Polyangiaceae bacterium]
MAESFASKVGELERALALVESSLGGAELARVRALVTAVLEVHRVALQDVRRVVGDAELGRAAAAEPSVAWVLACHDIDASVLERAVSAAEAKQARNEEQKSPAEGFVPVARLLRREGASTP